MADTGSAIGVMLVLFVGLAVVSLIMIFTGSLGGQTYTLVEPQLELIAQDMTADSFTASNTSAITLDHDDVVEGTLVIYNSTVNLGLGNFTINYDDGTVLLIGVAYNGGALLANYTYGDLDIENAARGSIVSSFNATKTGAQYLPLVVLAVVIFIVLALVLSASSLAQGGFGRGGGSAL